MRSAWRREQPSSREPLRRGARIIDRRQRRLDLLAQRLEPRREDELLAEMGGVLVGVEARSERGDLEEDARRLAEVDRLEPEAVDDLGRAGAGGERAFAPGLVVVHRGGEGDVVDGAGALAARLGRRRVVDPVSAARLAADLVDARRADVR